MSCILRRKNDAYGFTITQTTMNENENENENDIEE